ncbi:uncharacterized protein ARMOST_17963 [Armillaria ostoyae]|uniref:Uncharacterized protein n=1 Tax=Armillaria ostoyae TaxID=47428 RepID=A0A284S0F2_ARMOS|nr:uncharacterized protein ARMOST_17963 [Armillaria ostoyae]
MQFLDMGPGSDYHRLLTPADHDSPNQATAYKLEALRRFSFGLNLAIVGGYWALATLFCWFPVKLHDHGSQAHRSPNTPITSSLIAIHCFSLAGPLRADHPFM